MPSSKGCLFFLMVILAISLIGCGSATPAATPAATQPPQVVTVVITATPPPPTATQPLPSLTPIPTVALTATVPSAVSPTTGAVKPTNTPGAPKPAATRTPTKVAATATATALAMKFGAPVINKPVWTDNQKDEVKFYGGAIVFDWQAVGGLGSDECYLVQVRTEPVNGSGSQSDYWITNCGNQTQTGYSVKFTLESPNRIGTAPNYSSIILSNSSQMWAHWTLSVVKNLGQCDAAYQYHCKYAPLSPSSTNYFLFKGQ